MHSRFVVFFLLEGNLEKGELLYLIDPLRLSRLLTRHRGCSDYLVQNVFSMLILVFGQHYFFVFL